MSALKRPRQPIVLSVMLAITSVWIIVAIATQYSYGILHNNLDPANFFSFFTIESNILAALVLGIGAFVPLKQQPRWFSFLRGIATLCIITTGIVYSALLSGLEASLQTTIPWVNMVLHYIAPLIVLSWWMIVPPKHVWSFTHNLLWLIIPFGYVVYSLVRGASLGWYPYPFLNPADGGYGKVALMCGAMFIVLVGIVYTLTWLAKRSR